VNLIGFHFEQGPDGKLRLVLVDAGLREHEVHDPDQLWQALEAIDADPDLSAARAEAEAQAEAAAASGGDLRANLHAMGADAAEAYASDLIGEGAGRVVGRIVRNKGRDLAALLRMISRKPGRRY